MKLNQQISTKNNFKENLWILRSFLSSLLEERNNNFVWDTKENVVDIVENNKWSFLWNTLRKITWKRSLTQSERDKQDFHEKNQKDYIDQNIEFWESLWESSRFAEISPGLIWYFIISKKSSFDINSKKWFHENNLQPLNNDNLNKSYHRHNYTGVISKWTTPIALPEWTMIDIDSLFFDGNTIPKLERDTNKWLYISSETKQHISFNFYASYESDSSNPIEDEKTKIIWSRLTKETSSLISAWREELSLWEDNRSIAEKIVSHITYTKGYSLESGWMPRKKSNKKNFIYQLDKAKSLTSHDANTLFIALCREISIPARIVAWYKVKDRDVSWNTSLSQDKLSYWSEIWDDNIWSWIRLDATANQQKIVPQKYKQETPAIEPEKALKDLLDKIKRDDVISQYDEMEKALKGFSNAKSKQDIRKTIDEASVENFAKEIVYDIGNKEILIQEKKEILEMESEEEVRKAENSSLLDADYKVSFLDYAKEVKKRIEKERKRQQAEMRRMWFKKDELKIYKSYVKIERELEWDIRQQIRVLEKIMPRNLKIREREEQWFSSGSHILNTGKLVEYALTWDGRIFKKADEIQEKAEINMFETILIDRSGSMWKLTDTWSALREAVKAAIIRARVLEYFKVDFSIIMFDHEVEEIMSFWEKFSSTMDNNIPSKLMRAALKSGGTDMWAPLSFTLESMKEKSRKKRNKSFGNISFLWDGEPQSWLRWKELNTLIDEIRGQWFGLTAYYIHGSDQEKKELEWYFWSEKSWWTIVVWEISELKEKLIWSYNTNLRRIIKRYQR